MFPRHKVVIRRANHELVILRSPLSLGNEEEVYSSRERYEYPAFVKVGETTFMYLTAYYGDDMEGIYKVTKLVEQEDVNYDDISLEE